MSTEILVVHKHVLDDRELIWKEKEEKSIVIGDKKELVWRFYLSVTLC